MNRSEQYIYEKEFINPDEGILVNGEELNKKIAMSPDYGNNRLPIYQDLQKNESGIIMLMPVLDRGYGYHFMDDDAKNLIARADERNANLSQRYAEYMLRNENYIPESWEKVCIFFPGTRYGTPNRPHIPYLEHSPKMGWELKLKMGYRGIAAQEYDIRIPHLVKKLSI